METIDLRNLSTETMAYMGDAVYEQAVRERLVRQGHVRVDNLHHMAVRFVRADAQAKAIKKIFDELTEDEQALVKRARNHRFHSKAKHTDPLTYKWATAFEALVGFFYLDGNEERLAWFLDRTFDVIGD